MFTASLQMEHRHKTYSHFYITPTECGAIFFSSTNVIFNSLKKVYERRSIYIFTE